MMRIASVLALAVLSPSIARADSGDTGGWFVSAGGSLAYAFHDDSDSGGAAGLEVSTGRVWFPSNRSGDDDHEMPDFGINFNLDPTWVGGYADIIRDTGLDVTRVSIGAEVGQSVFGIDAGLLMQLGDDRRYGLSVRPVLTVGVVAVSLRIGRFFDDEPDRVLCELALLVKYPFEL